MIEPNSPRNLALRAYLEEQQALFRKATEYFRSNRANEPLSEAAEWMLDNLHLVLQACRQVREDMPPGFYRQLPKLITEPLKDYPHVYAIALKLVAMSAARLDVDRVTRFVHLYQDVAPLTTGELWALPVMLRLVLIEALAQAVSRITGLPRTRLLPAPALSHALTDDQIVANCIVSLRMLMAQDWQAFFESVSRVEQILRDDPAQVYAEMDRETRDRFRQVVEELAQATQMDEQLVARVANDLAGTSSMATMHCATHVGYYLLGAGRTQLESRLGYRPHWRTHIRRWILQHPTPVYLGSIGLCSLTIVLGGMNYAQDVGANLFEWLGVALLLLIPALTVAVNLVNWLVSVTSPPRVLPKLDFQDGIPADCKALVVVPALLSDSAQVQSLLQELELHFLRNQDPHLYFALLTDLPDARQPFKSNDDSLVKQTASEIRALNERYRREVASHANVEVSTIF